MNYNDLIDFDEDLLFRPVTPNMQVNVRWKPEVAEWIDYNLKFPVEFKVEVSMDGVLSINILFFDPADATLFKLFWC